LEHIVYYYPNAPITLCPKISHIFTKEGLRTSAW